MMIDRAPFIALALSLLFAPSAFAQEPPEKFEIIEIPADDLSLKADPGEPVDVRPLTGDALIEAALTIELEVAEAGAQAVGDRVDADYFIQRVAESRPIGALAVHSLRREFNPAELFFALEGVPHDEASYTFRGIVEDHGVERARFRLYEIDGGFNYHDILLGHDDETGFKVLDAWIMATGQNLSEAMADMLGILMAPPRTQAESPFAEFMGLFFAGEVREAWNAFPTDIELADVPLPLLNLRLHAGYELGDKEVIAASESVIAALPNTPTAALVAIDAHVFASEYEEGLRTLDRLEEFVGVDSAIDIMRALFYVLLEDHTAATEFARLATEREPDDYIVVSQEFDIAFDLGNYTRVVDLMEHMEQNLGVEFDLFTLEASPDFSGLILSPAYREWRAQREAQAESGS